MLEIIGDPKGKEKNSIAFRTIFGLSLQKIYMIKSVIIC